MASFLRPHDLLPSKEHTALLVIDIQERLAAAMPETVCANVLRNTTILLQAAGLFHLPTAISEQYPKGLGPTVSEIQASLPANTTPAAKLSFSCCAEAAFIPVLARLEERDILVCGMETHICVLQTVLDLLEQGRRVYVAADAVCSRTKRNWQIGLDVMRQAGAVIGSTEMFVFGLLGEAGTENFKAISRLVK